MEDWITKRNQKVKLKAFIRFNYKGSGAECYTSSKMNLQGQSFDLKLSDNKIKLIPEGTEINFAKKYRSAFSCPREFVDICGKQRIFLTKNDDGSWQGEIPSKDTPSPDPIDIRPCPSFPGYSATDTGLIISQKRKLHRVLTLSNSSTGYLTVNIVSETGVKQTKLAHYLVADAFHGPHPEGKIIGFKNLIKNDISPKNLFYTTWAERGLTLKPRGEKHYRAKLTSEDVITIRALYKKGNRICEISKLYGTHVASISNIVHNRSWKHLLD